MPDLNHDGAEFDRHASHLRSAVAEAVRGVTEGLGSPFGAVLVRDEETLAATCNEVIARCNPLAHAEILAVEVACGVLRTRNLAGCTVYTSCKPCPMCLAALAFGQVSAVYFAATPEDAAAGGMAPPAAVRAMRVTVGDAGGGVRVAHLPIPERFQPFEAWQNASSHPRYAEQLAAPAKAADGPSIASTAS